MGSGPYIRYNYPDPTGFLISSTLRGAKFELGCVTRPASPMTVSVMLLFFLHLDMHVLDDLVFWMMVLAGFRGLLRKTNLCELGYAVCTKDVEFCQWGVKLVICKSKTITFGERVFSVPFARILCSCFCFERYLQLYMSNVKLLPDSYLFCRYVKGSLQPVSYAWFNGRLGDMCLSLGVSKLTSHSLRHGGAQALDQVGVPLAELKEIGDWRSWSVLLYLLRPFHQRVLLESINSRKLFL